MFFHVTVPQALYIQRGKKAGEKSMPVSARHGVTSSIWGRLRILSISVAVSHGEIQCPILEVKKRGPR